MVSALAERLARGPMLHLDWLDYAAALMGPVEWGDPASVAALVGKAQALLPSDLIALPVERVAQARVAADPALRHTLAARPLAAAPLRALLADQGLRASLADSLARLAPVRGGASLALALPGPVSFARLAAGLGGAAEPQTDEDLADDAAVYLADFLRAFATAPLEAVMLGETSDDARFRGLAAPIARVAGGYGWTIVGLGGEVRPETPALSADFWNGGDGPAWSGLASILVPAEARPEDVVAAVARLRGRG